jgi:hypothetical protein
MVSEFAILDVRPGQEAAFEAAFDQAKEIIASSSSCDHRSYVGRGYEPLPPVRRAGSRCRGSCAQVRPEFAGMLDDVRARSGR